MVFITMFSSVLFVINNIYIIMYINIVCIIDDEEEEVRALSIRIKHKI